MAFVIALTVIDYLHIEMQMAIKVLTHHGKFPKPLYLVRKQQKIISHKIYDKKLNNFFPVSIFTTSTAVQNRYTVTMKSRSVMYVTWPIKWFI